MFVPYVAPQRPTIQAPFKELSFSDKCGYILNEIANFVILAGFFTISLLTLIFLLIPFPSDPYVRPHVEETPEMQEVLDKIAEYHRMNPTGISPPQILDQEADRFGGD